MIEHQIVTEEDLLRYTLLSRTRLSDSGCWEWTGNKRAGYGQLSHKNKTSSAHRISYQAFVGPIPIGMVICHSCDNPSCINPAHLRPGTMKENMADRDSRNRRDVKGEDVGTAKLTEKEVLQIKATNGMKDISLDFLAQWYGVDRSNIWQIRTGKSWKHLNQLSAQ